MEAAPIGDMNSVDLEDVPFFDINPEELNSTVYPIKPNYLILYKLDSDILSILSKHVVTITRQYIEDFVDVPVGVRYFVYKNRDNIVYIRVFIVLKEDFNMFKKKYNRGVYRQFGEFRFRRVYCGRTDKENSRFNFFKGSEISMIITKALKYEGGEISKGIINTWFMDIDKIKYNIVSKGIEFYVTIRIIYNFETIFLRTFVARLAYTDKMEISQVFKSALSFIQIKLADVLYFRYDELDRTYSLDVYKRYGRYEPRMRYVRKYEYQTEVKNSKVIGNDMLLEEQEAGGNTLAKLVHDDLSTLQSIAETAQLKKEIEAQEGFDVYGPYIVAVDLINKTDLKN